MLIFDRYNTLDGCKSGEGHSSRDDQFYVEAMRRALTGLMCWLKAVIVGMAYEGSCVPLRPLQKPLYLDY